jgi:hypothetical protein
VPWNFFEAPDALLALRQAQSALQSRLIHPKRAHVPKLVQAVRDLETFTLAYEDFSIHGKGSVFADSFFHKISFAKLSGLERFYLGTLNGWSCLFWMDDPTETCIALVTYRSPGKFVPSVELLEHMFTHSTMISAAFCVLEQLLINWLQQGTSINIKRA